MLAFRVCPLFLPSATTIFGGHEGCSSLAIVTLEHLGSLSPNTIFAWEIYGKEESRLLNSRRSLGSSRVGSVFQRPLTLNLLPKKYDDTSRIVIQL